MSRLITLFSDASWCPDTLRGAYACWWKVDGRASRDAGVLKEGVPSSQHAELFAMANGIWLVCKRTNPPAGSRIIAQTDCMAVIHLLTGARRRSADHQQADAKAFVHGLLRQQDIRIEFRHVKGHKGNATPRNAVNSWCDKTCRTLMQRARAEVGR